MRADDASTPDSQRSRIAAEANEAIARILDDEETRQVQEEWEAEFAGRPAPGAGISCACCGAPRRPLVGLRTRGQVWWPFPAPRRPQPTPHCPRRRCDPRRTTGSS
jgi:hypothetical protein